MISVQNFWARMQLTTKSLVGLMCLLVILVPLYFFFSFNSLAQHLSVGSMENSSVALLQPAHAKCSPRGQWVRIGENKVKNDTLHLDSVQQR